MPLNYLTAYVGLVRFAGVRPGEQVLIHAAAGGVGLAGVQLAAQRGARVIATASPTKHEFLRAQPGVEHVVDYTRPSWDDEVRELSGGGVDVVLDGVGEDGYLKSLRTLRYGGRLAASGYSSGIVDRSTPPDQASGDLETLSVPFFELFANGWTFSGVNPNGPPEALRAWMDELFSACLSGELAPRVDQVFPLAEAASAHEHLHDRRNIGKVLLRP